MVIFGLILSSLFSYFIGKFTHVHFGSPKWFWWFLFSLLGILRLLLFLLWFFKQRPRSCLLKFFRQFNICILGILRVVLCRYITASVLQNQRYALLFQVSRIALNWVLNRRQQQVLLHWSVVLRPKWLQNFHVSTFILLYFDRKAMWARTIGAELSELINTLSLQL